MILRTLTIALAGILSFSAAAETGMVDGVAAIDNIELLVADNPRKDRRDNRQEGRDDRRDCRQEEGRIGDDKRDCKQEERGEGGEDEAEAEGTEDA
jgi:hypothetical protein